MYFSICCCQQKNQDVVEIDKYEMPFGRDVYDVFDMMQHDLTVFKCKLSVVGDEISNAIQTLYFLWQIWSPHYASTRFWFLNVNVLKRLLVSPYNHRYKVTNKNRYEKQH